MKSTDLNLALKQLVEIVAQLRGPDGCPWDKEQNQKTLAPYAIEESFELAEAIETGDQKLIREELGDFLFQVILQSQVAEDEGHFSFKEVVENLSQKMISRHPHVFTDHKKTTTEDVWKNWHQIKAAEKQNRQDAREPFTYPLELPALQAAGKIGVKAKSYQFDWDRTDDVMKKVVEELGELEEALQMDSGSDRQKSVEHELGDLLFSIAQVCRKENMDPEQVLRSANRRFENRFRGMLKNFTGSKEEIRQKFLALPTEEKETHWRNVKKKLHGQE